MVMEKEKKYQIKYNYPPKSKNVQYVDLHAKTYEEAIVIAKCMFGVDRAKKHLVEKMS
jgi:hypothetical protein